MTENKPFHLDLCPEGQKLLDEYKKIKADDVKFLKKFGKFGETLQKMNKYNALKKYVDHRNDCEVCNE